MRKKRKENGSKSITMKKISVIKGIFSAVLYLLILVLGAALAAVLIFDMKLFCIQTGSMEPSYPVGTMVAVEPVSFEELSEGDVITFAAGGAAVTHRIVGINKETQQLTTKGDNNNVTDGSFVSYENLIGRVRFGVPVIGYAVLLLNTNFGKIMVGILIAAVIGVFIILRMYRRYSDEEEEDEDEDGVDKVEKEKA